MTFLKQGGSRGPNSGGFKAFPKPLAKPFHKSDTKPKHVKKSTTKNAKKTEKKIERNEKQRVEIKDVLAKMKSKDVVDKILKHLKHCSAESSDILVLARIFLEQDSKTESE
jgi:hypothetical protein